MRDRTTACTWCRAVVALPAFLPAGLLFAALFAALGAGAFATIAHIAFAGDIIAVVLGSVFGAAVGVGLAEFSDES